MDISLELYRVFYTVAKHSSFSLAAQELFVSQSAVSQSIKTIEERLGYKLFVRTTKSVELTIDGRILYDSIKDAFALLYEGLAKIRTDENPYSGQIILASTDTLCKYFLLDKIKDILIKYPSIKIKIINRTSHECLELLARSEIDFALINFPDNLDRRLFKVEQSYEFSDTFIAGANSGLPSKMTMAKIARQPLLVLDTKSTTRKFLNSLFFRENLTIEPEIELQSIDILIELTKINMGISFVPDICLNSANKPYIKEISTNCSIPKRTFGVLSNSSTVLPAVVRNFINNLA